MGRASLQMFHTALNACKIINRWHGSMSADECGRLFVAIGLMVNRDVVPAEAVDEVYNVGFHLTGTLSGRFGIGFRWSAHVIPLLRLRGARRMPSHRQLHVNQSGKCIGGDSLGSLLQSVT